MCIERLGGVCVLKGWVLPSLVSIPDNLVTAVFVVFELIPRSIVDIFGHGFSCIK